LDQLRFGASCMSPCWATRSSYDLMIVSQRLADAALGDGPGVALVADPRNGQILAMVSKPSFDANRIDEPGYWESLQSGDGQLLNPRAGRAISPGSLFKRLPWRTLCQAGSIHCRRCLAVKRRQGPCSWADGAEHPANNLPPGVSQVTLEDAYKYSDNIVFANIGTEARCERPVQGSARFWLWPANPLRLARGAEQGNRQARFLESLQHWPPAPSARPTWWRRRYRCCS